MVRTRSGFETNSMKLIKKVKRSSKRHEIKSITEKESLCFKNFEDLNHAKNSIIENLDQNESLNPNKKCVRFLDELKVRFLVP
jgi:hypothetical protein